MDVLLSFWFQYLPFVIESLVILILAGVIYVNVVMLKNRTQGEGNRDLDDIEKTLKKLLTATETKGSLSFDKSSSKKGESGKKEESGSQSNLVDEGIGGGRNPEVVRQLESEISTKESKIKALEEEVKKFQETSLKKEEGPSREELAKNLKELEAKLADYEIIEDDIADLTLYKDENQKLKAEIEELKKTTSSLPPQAASTASAASAASSGSAESSPATPAAQTASEAKEVDDDLMAEFAAAVAEQNAGTLKDESEPIPVAASAGSVESSSEAEEVDDDLMAAFAAAVAEQNAGTLKDEPDAEVAAEVVVEEVIAQETAPLRVVDPPTKPEVILTSQPKYRSGDDIFEEFLVEDSAADIESETLDANVDTMFDGEKSVQGITEEIDEDGAVVISIDGNESEISQELLDQLKNSMDDEPSVSENDSITDELMEEFRSKIVGKKRKKLPERKVKINIVNSKPAAKVSGDSLDYQLDTDKMISEVADLKVVEDETGGSALDAELNTDKMLSEVDALNAFSHEGSDE